jgi:hypothetical protein
MERFSLLLTLFLFWAVILLYFWFHRTLLNGWKELL